MGIKAVKDLLLVGGIGFNNFNDASMHWMIFRSWTSSWNVGMEWWMNVFQSLLFKPTFRQFDMVYQRTALQKFGNSEHKNIYHLPPDHIVLLEQNRSRKILTENSYSGNEWFNICSVNKFLALNDVKFSMINTFQHLNKYYINYSYLIRRKRWDEIVFFIYLFKFEILQIQLR